MISLLDYYNNTYIYYPLDKNEIIFFQSDKGYMVRAGLCVYAIQTKGRFNYHTRAAHFSLQDNIGFKIIKRGMPRLYEYNINQKYKKLSCNNFNEVLLKEISQFYDTIKIPKVNIRKIKIKSQILFQISYNKENLSWIVSDSTKICVIFKEITEINNLFKEKKIGNNIRKICEECFRLFDDILKKKNEDDNFLNIISSNTFLGFFFPDNEEIVFYSIVSNSPTDLDQFCLPISKV